MSHAIRQGSLVKHLAHEIAGEVRFDATTRRLYATDASHYQILPIGVVLPKSLDDLVTTVQIAGEAALDGMPGKRKPVTFVEDCAVSPERMPKFAIRFRDILQKHGTKYAYYVHASVGCLHIRPLLDLDDRHDVAKLRPIMSDGTALVREFNGSLSGEHNYGIVRSEWNRVMFGPTMYDTFRRIKQTCDPKNNSDWYRVAF